MAEVSGFDPRVALDQIISATEHLLESAAKFGDAEMREPSLLPGWSRGHVLTHLARNADGGGRLMRWARTGVETSEYPSLLARAEEIELGNDRGAAELVADVRDSAARFAMEYAKMPTEAWYRIVRWTGGKEQPALRVADARLTEVLVHHVDLRAGFTPYQWPRGFVGDMLTRVVSSFNSRNDTAAMRCYAKDTDTWYQIKETEDATVVHGTQTALLAWLMGRSGGADVWPQNGAGLPTLPPLF
jgi:maleylpyruvate isomerase